VPRPEDLQRAADALNAGSKVVILVGAGIAKALLGKAAVQIFA
jgi:pyruvate dehydrogenase (quinone)